MRPRPTFHVRRDGNVIVRNARVCRDGSFPGPEPGERMCIAPGALRRAAAKFNLVPVVVDHVCRKNWIVGCAMDRARYEDGFVYQDLLLWHPKMLEILKLGRQISPSLHYLVDRGVVTDIKSVNHLSFGERGRLGPEISL
jgi:hypothetical protein